VAAIQGFGAYVPSRVVGNDELAARLKCEPDWIRDMSGIEERRYARDDESVVSMGVEAGRRCLENTGLTAGEIGLLMVSSGSSGRQFPGPAAAVARGLGMEQTPAFDLPLASAGALFGMSLAADLASRYGNVLVVATEKMSSIVAREPASPGVAILFGDGAGACLISTEGGKARILDSVLHSDGSFAEDLRLEFGAPLAMNGRSVIMQASRKIPGVIGELLQKNHRGPGEVEVFLMHQANQNLIDRVARSLQVESGKFFSNIGRYGNTSSASMLIAAAEWWERPEPKAGRIICFATFGAGFHWGAMLAAT
jgi:3-oxoacyl-[acyl-carrier-protein] synthase-3